MRLNILENTYIRSNPYDVGEPLGVLYSGVVVEVEDHPVPGNEPTYANGLPESRWYRDIAHDWYYWAGSTEPATPPAAQLPDYRGIFPLPDSWLRTNGRGLRIGLVDTGFDLDHPGLSRYRLSGRCFDLSSVAKDNGYAGSGSDNVAPDRPDDYHGTECAGIAAALAPEAELFFFKVKQNRLLQLLQTLKLARANGIRLVSVSLAYDDIFRLGTEYAEMRGLFTAAGQALSGQTLLVASLNNPESRLEVINEVPFPASWKPYSLAVGALDSSFFAKFPQKPVLAPEIDLLTHSPRPFAVAAPGGKTREARYSSSYSAAFLTGMLALGAAAMKSNEDTKDSSIQDFFRKMAEGMMTYAQAAQSVSVQQKLLFINPKI